MNSVRYGRQKEGKEILIVESGDNKVKNEKMKQEEELRLGWTNRIDCSTVVLVATNSITKTYPSSLYPVVY